MIIHFENKSIAPTDLQKWKNKDFFLSANELSAAKFIEDWYSGVEAFNFKTSGSTGNPKKINIKRELLIISAKNTLESLHISSGGNALICINTKFIGGAMMLVRAIINEMDIYFTPLNSNPIISLDDKKYDLCAMVPAQVHEILSNQKSKRNLSKIKNLLIGGGTIDFNLLNALPEGQCNFFHTYGMTETVSHVALKKINKNQINNPFIAVGDNEFSSNNKNQLIIKGSITDNQQLLTNDIVHLISNKEFKWLGRIDNVINSGGIKLFPEQIEVKLSAALLKENMTNRFFISSKKDQKFGEIVILIVEGLIDEAKLKSTLKDNLDKYEIPKVIHFVDKFAETETGKINRHKTKETNEI